MKQEFQLSEKQNKLLEFVKQQHGTQLRKYTFDPYWTHVLSVAQIVSEFVKDSFAIEIALCHDLFEDTQCTTHQLCNELVNIGYEFKQAADIISGTDELTDEFTKEKYPTMNRSARKKKEAERLGSISKVAQSVKYADLIDNTPSIVGHDPSFAKMYLSEKLDILNCMRNGDINLFIRCCFAYQSAIDQLEAEQFIIEIANMKWYQRIFLLNKILKFLRTRSKYKF